MTAAGRSGVIRALLVDDEPVARAGLRELLAGEPDIVVIGEAGDGEAAARAVLDERPDLVFLDIQMPGVDGFGVVEAVGPAAMPAVVFVTAFDRYAVRAFEVHALDYLLKPVDPERFRLTLSRVREKIASGAASAPNDEVLRALRGVPGAFPERVLIRDREKLLVVETKGIETIEADGDYVRIRRAGGTITARGTMASMESRLDPARFARIHRSTIIALRLVREVRPLFSGDAAVVLHDGTKLTLSRMYRAGFMALLGDERSAKKT